MVIDLNSCILFENKRFAVVDKPAGVPTAGDSLEQPGSLQHALMQAEGRMVWAVHQLDKETSGVNLFVKRKSLVQPLSDAIQQGCKEYIAVTSPLPEGTQERFDIKEPLDYCRKEKKHKVMSGGKPAHSRVSVLLSTSKIAVLKVRLITGRTHQIRAHLAHLGISILGDDRYADDRYKKASRRQALHAWRLDADFPELQEIMPILAPLPDKLMDLVSPEDREGLLSQLGQELTL